VRKRGGCANREVEVEGRLKLWWEDSVSPGDVGGGGGGLVVDGVGWGRQRGPLDEGAVYWEEINMTGGRKDE
jgi:hypothetical protein